MLQKTNQARHPSGAALTLLASLVCSTVGSAHAQTDTSAEALPTVTVKATSPRVNQASITGFGDTPAWQLPMQAQTFSSTALKNNGVQRLSDLTSLDASISDSYNAQGYWDFLSVRGFTLDNAYNYRREGLPIIAETSIPLDNKDGIEVLKGTSGMQAGVSSPGGLVNYLVKRPTGHVRSATLAFTGGSSVLGAVDLSERFGVGQAFGLRLNAAYEHLDPNERYADGKRHLLALATDWRVNTSNLLEFEIERSRRQQASVPGFSLLGGTLPAANTINPDINLNHQPWAMPVVMEATTGTLRWTSQLNADWGLTTTYGIQQLYSDDRTVFPFGCGSSLASYCSDGTFDVYDYQSEAEKRISQALNIALQSKPIKVGGTAHALRLAALRTSQRTDLNSSAFNPLSGPGNISGEFGPYARNPLITTAQHIRHLKNTELSVSDAITLSDQWHAWLGLRHTQLHRYVALSTQSLAGKTAEQTFTTPWAALGYTFAPKRQVYASWGEGVESPNAPDTTPAFAAYANAGEPLPAQKSRQFEIGVKGQETEWGWALNAFQIHRPQAGTINTLPDPTYTLDGQAVHTGLEGQLQSHWGPWDLNASAMLLHAERQGSANAQLNGKQPVNVPDYTFKLSADYKVAMLQGLTLQGQLVHEGRRMVLEDNSISIPAWSRVDTGLRYVQGWRQQGALTWRLGIKNLFDTRAWREAPLQFNHAYLFPLARRTVTASVQADF
ncbi:MAG: TonB-dependent siderophore receptor [Aquabacterium sp.]|uniref:TonB-dependent siderophore receptor n=1 Tax=Aquabacterium sp. TaxID=1872578 RepID=UPI0027277188|nr:TonB-dependent siderophore receptor [Aquabacterium sp.]MDO9003008.1 TonB-dependent siderophore receptor [Aquabacterium sp.]